MSSNGGSVSDSVSPVTSMGTSPALGGAVKELNKAAEVSKVQQDIALQNAQILAGKNAKVDAAGAKMLDAPGRAQTLLTSNYGQPGNTLLTVSRRS